MASIFSHGFIAICLSKAGFKTKLNRRIIIAGIFLSILPDLDVISFALGIPYESIWGHRGFSHSIIFAVIISIMFSIYFFKFDSTNSIKHRDLFVFFLLSILSHGLLDAMTTGGLGVGFFIPFDNSRYFFSYRPILVSPIGIKDFFSSWGLAVIKSEIKIIGLIGILILFVGYLIKR